MYCRNCGADNKPEAKFCMRCGTGLPVAASPQPPPHAPSPHPAAPHAASAPPPSLSVAASAAALPPSSAQIPAAPKSAAWILLWSVLAVATLGAVAAGIYYFAGARRPADDSAALQRVKAAILDEPSLQGWMIGVASHDGVVTLSGSVGSEADKLNAERIANAQPGVKRVVDLLIIQAGGRAPSPVADTAAASNAAPAAAAAPAPAPMATARPPEAAEQQQPPTISTRPEENRRAGAVPPSSAAVIPPPRHRDTTQHNAPRPVVVGAMVRPGSTSIALPPGDMYLYGLVTGGEFPTSPFDTGPFAQTINAAGQLTAALAYGTNSQNSFSTQAKHRLIGGASVSGTWSDFHAFYGSNGRAKAYIVAATFTVKSNALVVVIASASAHGQANIQGVPGLQLDAQSRGNSLPMLIGHAYLPPGQYVASETSTASPGQAPDRMADMIGVFVFESGN